MKQKNCLDNEFVIIFKTPDDISWQTKVDKISTPLTITFAISANMQTTAIKKIMWDFGTGNQIKSLTNRKQDLDAFEIDCKYKKSHDSTITIQASVYTETEMFIPEPIVTSTVNHVLKAHYVEPEVFKNQIMKYYETNVFTDDVAESIYKIANRLAFAGNFINYTYREEMVGDAVVRMIEALTTQKFDPLKGNPFSYFTKIAFHAFCNRIKKEKKIRDALINYQNDVYGGMTGELALPYSRPDHTHDSNDYYHEDM
jgi:hypothetical protein